MNTRLRFAVTLVAVAAMTVACGGGKSSSTAPTPSAGTTVSSAPTSSAPGEGGAATSTPPVAPHLPWPTSPVTVTHHPAVPPVPVLTGVRYAAHPREGYDRIVFDISGAMPGYSVKYVTQVHADPSDKPVSVPGHRHLLVVMNPAQAHRDDGTATVTGVHHLDLPNLESYAVVGDHEGYVSIALGVDHLAGFRVGELPGRLYLDIAAG
ncbi:hypothetical protein ODJ79_37570 [Actinoplanes sp. KI2]|uniref:AMIN-like domain-containing (lipo)protein n=1 Tax=Actinoplanes sp. KI2 TaxID=2983315 RepID=UPI0021D5CCC5|nr:hypothetical protein [Actinoplanes sp. KI2]MCU7729459.1 hypothetical protein [Actinoplanes sp. KI2]